MKDTARINEYITCASLTRMHKPVDTKKGKRKGEKEGSLHCEAPASLAPFVSAGRQWVTIMRTALSATSLSTLLSSHSQRVDGSRVYGARALALPPLAYLPFPQQPRHRLLVAVRGRRQLNRVVQHILPLCNLHGSELFLSGFGRKRLQPSLCAQMPACV